MTGFFHRDRVQDAKTGARRVGFTLIEVLAAMAVLSIIIVMLGRLFSDSSAAWTSGTRRTDLDSSARAAFDFMSLEIGQAVVDDLISMVVSPNATTNLLGIASDSIRFVAVSNKAERRSGTSYRDAQAIVYFVSTTHTNQTAGLWRRTSEKFNVGSTLARAYSGDANWWTQLNLETSGFDANVISPEVIKLKFSVTNTNVTTYANGYNSKSNGPPLWVDIYLELLSPQEFERALLMSGSARTDYIRQKARRYSSRVFLQNRQQPVTY